MGIIGYTHTVNRNMKGAALQLPFFAVMKVMKNKLIKRAAAIALVLWILLLSCAYPSIRSRDI